MAQAIDRNPDIMHGTPVFRGTRVPVQTLFDYLEGGERLEDFLEGFPTVSRRFGPGSTGTSQAVAACSLLMRLLIDECVDERVRGLFVGHDCQTARYAKLAGIANG